MQGLQSPVHHFGELGVLRDIADGNLFALQAAAGASRTEDLHALVDKRLSERSQTQFVADAN